MRVRGTPLAITAIINAVLTAAVPAPVADAAEGTTKYVFIPVAVSTAPAVTLGDNGFSASTYPPASVATLTGEPDTTTATAITGAQITATAGRSAQATTTMRDTITPVASSTTGAQVTTTGAAYRGEAEIEKVVGIVGAVAVLAML